MRIWPGEPCKFCRITGEHGTAALHRERDDVSVRKVFASHPRLVQQGTDEPGQCTIGVTQAQARLLPRQQRVEGLATAATAIELSESHIGHGDMTVQGKGRA